MELQDELSASTQVGFNTTDQSHQIASPSMAALNIAANFHRDTQACASKAERQLLHREYRDQILAIDKLGANIAAAFLPFFGASSSLEGPDAERWSDFDRLAQRGKNMRDRQSQHIRHQSGVIAAWGGERVRYYGWEALPLPLLRQVHELAVLVPCWADVVDLLNSKMLIRHELRLVRGHNKTLLIGEHSAASKVQDRRSPVERSDIISVLEAARHKGGPMELRQQMDRAADKIKQTSLGNFGLERDLYSMLVPSTAYDGSGERASPSSPTSPSSLIATDIYSTPSKRTKLAPVSAKQCTNNSDGDSDDHTVLEARLQLELDFARSNGGSPQHTASASSPMEVVEVVGTLEAGACDNGAIGFNSSPESSPEPESYIQVRDADDNYGDQESSHVESDGEDREDETSDDPSEQGDEMQIDAEPDTVKEIRDVESESYATLQDLALPTHGSNPVEMEALDALFNMSRENSYSQMETQGPSALTSPGSATPEDTCALPQAPDCTSPGTAGVSQPPAAVAKEYGSPYPHRTEQPQSPDLPTPVPVNPILLDNPESQGFAPTLLQKLRARYDPEIGRMIDELQQTHASEDVMRQRSLQLEWLGEQRWASIYVEPEHALGRGCVVTQDDAEVCYLDWETFRSYSESEHVFKRPVVIKQKFQDSGMYNIADYIDMLWQRFPEQQIVVQNSMTGTRTSMSVKDYCLMVAEVDLNSFESAAPVSNAINLGRLAQADEPLLTRLLRFGLLSVLADRVAGVIGRSEKIMLNEVKVCLGFNMLGFSGAFSGSRVDPLVGSWVRCLAGFSIWAIAPGLNADDWKLSSREGREWSPQGKSRLIVLEQDDVLLMPPGLLASHANFVPRRCLAEGGMLWDECRIPEIIEGLLYRAQNQQCIDMPSAIELRALIDSLETWLDIDNCIDPSSHSGNTSEYHQVLSASIKSLRELL